MISFQNVTKDFDGRIVLDNVTCSIEPGEFVCLTGPSGAGKSTMIQLLIRAHVPTSGGILGDSSDISLLPAPRLQMGRQRVGVLFQDYKLLPDRTVYENIAYPMEVCGEPDDVIAERVQFLLERLRLTERGDAFPRELSGGEMTRVSLARAMVNQPSILLADEPTGNIDPDQSREILEILRQINAEGTTVILATHDKLVVDALGVRVIRLEVGRIVRDSIGDYDHATIMPTAPAPEQVPSSAEQISVVEEEPSSVGTTDDESKESTPLTPPAPQSLKGRPTIRGLPMQGRYVPKSPAKKDDVEPKIPPSRVSKKPEDDSSSFLKGSIKPVREE